MRDTQALVIAGILEYGDYETIKSLLKPDDFRGIYKVVFERYLELSNKLSSDGIYVDELAISRDLRERPIQKGSQLIDSYYIKEGDRCVGKESLKNVIAQLKRENKRDKIILGIDHAGRAIDENDLEYARQVLRGIDEQMAPERPTYDYLKEMSTLVANLRQEEKQGILVGFKSIDEATGGLQPGNLIVLGGRTSQGKTSLAVNFAYNLAFSGKKVLFVSLEMTKPELFKKIISLDTGVPYEKVRSGWLTNEQWKKIKDKNNQFYSLGDLIIVDDLFTLDDMHDSISGHKPDVVIIDYIQIMRFSKGENRAYQIEETMKGLKQVAKKEKCAVIVLSQINREQESGDKKPHLHNLKGSGSLEESGDVVLLIHWPFKYDDSNPKKEIHLYIEKNRHGRTGKILLKFEPNSGKYTCDNKSEMKSASKGNS